MDNSNTSYSFVQKNLSNYGIDIKEKPFTSEELKEVWKNEAEKWKNIKIEQENWEKNKKQKLENTMQT
jgi:tRNA/tmRNA/rRNA uracil-C5-methylase (TrmA/RlmC/RlmD family)